MDVDELLGDAGLPDVEVDTDAALARTAQRWRVRRQRRLVAVGVGAVIVLAGVALAVTRDRDQDPVEVRTATTVQQGRWRSMARAPLSARHHAVAAWTGDEMIVVGGNECSPLAYCQEETSAFRDGAAYDPEEDSWRRIADAPVAFARGSATWIGDRLLVAADVGEGPTRRTQPYSYDPADDEWTTLEPPVVGLLGPVPVLLRDPVWTGVHWILTNADPTAKELFWSYEAEPTDDWATAEWTPIVHDPFGAASERRLVWTGDEAFVLATVEGEGASPDEPGYLAYAMALDGAGRSGRLPKPGFTANGQAWVSSGDWVVNPAVGMFDGGSGTWQRLQAHVPPSVGGATGYLGDAGGWVVSDHWILDPATRLARAIEPRPGDPAKTAAAAVWTGKEILSWGGLGNDQLPRATGGAYRPPARPEAPSRPMPSTTTASTEPHPCPAAEGGLFDVAGEPAVDRPGARRWTDGEGCMVRVDAIHDRQGPSHCGWEGVRLITVVPEVGRGLTGATRTVTYIRDPDGVLGRPELVQDLDLDADLPTVGGASGFESGDEQIWFTAAWDGAIWIRGTSSVERWPAAEPPVCR